MTTSNNPLGRPAKDMVGLKFGRLTVTGFAYRRGPKPCWYCKCDCGGEAVVRGDNLRRKDGGATTSCGCMRTDTIRRVNKEIAQGFMPRPVATGRKKNSEAGKRAFIQWEDNIPNWVPLLYRLLYLRIMIEQDEFAAARTVRQICGGRVDRRLHYDDPRRPREIRY